MSTAAILAIIFVLASVTLNLEKRTNWVAHFSGISLFVLISILLSAFNFIPKDHPTYDVFFGPIAFIAIVLLVLGLNLSFLKSIPRSLPLIALWGVLGTVCGGVTAGILSASYLGENSAKIAAQLVASYTGGGENAIAMQKILNIENEVFVAAFTIDNILTSSWLAICVAICKFRKDNLSHYSVSDEVSSLLEIDKISFLDVTTNIGIAAGIVFISQYLSKLLNGTIHPILIMTTLAIIISQYKPFQSNLRSSYVLGAVLILPFFFAIGAISDISKISSVSPVILVMPVIIIFFQVIFLFVGKRIHKISVTETLLFSQALVGGPATAAALAQSIGWRAGLFIGIGIGIIGYAAGTYIGLLTYWAVSLLAKI